jgi:6-phosphofructokinase 1
MEGLGSKREAAGGRDAFGHVRLSKRSVGGHLAEMIESKTGLETRTTVLGYVQRGGSPTAYDRIWATRVGVAAYDLVRSGKWGSMPVVHGGSVGVAPIAEVVAETRRVPRELYELCQIFY